MDKVARIEGFLFIPPDTVVRNPEISLMAKEPQITEGVSKNFTHKGIVIPSLVNCHTHLTISAPIHASSFVPWIEKIVSQRPFASPNQGTIKKQIQESKRYGVYTLFDIQRDSIIKEEGIVPFYEIVGDAKTPLPELPSDVMVSPHAPYSVDEALLAKIAEKYKNKLISIHVAESEEEIKFIQGKPNLIEERIYPLVGRKRTVGVYCSSIEVLDRCNILTKRTILVHCCFIDSKDVETIAQRECTVCVCPRSNLYLSQKMAPVERLIKSKVNVVIGTDSLGSTPNLNLWEEARTLFLTHKIEAKSVLSMMTTNPRKIPGIRTPKELIIIETTPSTAKPNDLAFELLYTADRCSINPLF